RPGRRGWAARSGHGSRRGSAGCCSNWAATTRQSSHRPLTSTSPCAASCSRPPAPRASGARRCAGSSHTSVIDELTDRLAAAYRRLPIGSPLQQGILVGPLIHDRAWKSMTDGLAAARDQGGTLVAGGGRRL